MKMKPLADRVVIKPLAAEEKTKGRNHPSRHRKGEAGHRRGRCGWSGQDHGRRKEDYAGSEGRRQGAVRKVFAEPK